MYNITIDQVPAEVVKAWVINNMLMEECNWLASSYSVAFDNLHYEVDKEGWFVLTLEELEANNKLHKDHQSAITDNLKMKLGLLNPDFTSKTKNDFETEDQFREVQLKFARTLIAELTY